jgi:hypothetical protein
VALVLQRNSLDRPGFMPARYCKTSSVRVHKLIGAALERVGDGRRLGVGNPSML